jgi:tetratricopeptide (TPR) repeat protein
MFNNTYFQSVTAKTKRLSIGFLFFLLLEPMPLFASDSAGSKRYFDAANRYLQKGAYQTADQVFSVGMKKYPQSGNLVYGRATLRANNLMKLNEAVTDYSRVIKLRDESCSQCAKAFCYRGITLYRLGQYELALRDLTNSLKIIPNYNKARVYRAYTYAKIGMMKDAIKDAKLAIKAKNHAVMAQQLLEKIYSGRSDF